jgi:hypothetical protein
MGFVPYFHIFHHAPPAEANEEKPNRPSHRKVRIRYAQNKLESGSLTIYEKTRAEALAF